MNLKTDIRPANTLCEIEPDQLRNVTGGAGFIAMPMPMPIKPGTPPPVRLPPVVPMPKMGSVMSSEMGAVYKSAAWWDLARASGNIR